MASTSSDEEDMVLYYYDTALRRMRRKARKYWVHPYLELNVHRRLFVAAKELNTSDSNKFLAFYRMSKQSYFHLVEMVSPAINKHHTNMRECVKPDERILITLRYLATGDSFVSLGLYFARGETTVGRIVAETSKVLWEVLQDVYMPLPRDEMEWKRIAERFESLWDLPNCVGALDGKHIRIEKLPNTGSTNFNYKHYHSTVLMACCDADGLFTMIECGYAGRNSDGGIFHASSFKYWLTRSHLNIPPPSKLPHDANESLFPYYFVGDEAFPLSSYLMRPYSKRVLDNVKRVFNYRLSRGRKTIECTFGMMAEKFQVLNSPIRCRSIEKVNDIVKAVCVLHNYVRKREGIRYTTSRESEQVHGDTTDENIVVLEPLPQRQINTQSTASDVRNYLANYFITPRAALQWQWKYCV